MEIILLLAVFVLVVAALMVLKRPSKSTNNGYNDEYQDPRDDWKNQGPGIW